MYSYLDELYAHQEWADAEHWRALDDLWSIHLSYAELRSILAEGLGSASTDCPGTCGQVNPSLGLYRERGFHALANCGLDGLAACREIVWRRALPGQKWFPVIIKVCEAGYYVDRMQS